MMKMITVTMIVAVFAMVDSEDEADDGDSDGQW